MLDDTSMRQLRIDYALAVKHGGKRALAERFGISTHELRAIADGWQQEDGRVRWASVSDDTLSLLLDALARSREPVNRFAARHGYSVATLSKTLASRFPERYRSVVDANAVEAGARYRLGADLERRVMKRLDASGFVIMRSAGSHTVADIMAVKSGVILLIQCKRGGVLPRDEWNALVRGARQAGGHPVLVENPFRGETRWWELVEERDRGSSGLKRPLAVALAKVRERREAVAMSKRPTSIDATDEGQA